MADFFILHDELVRLQENDVQIDNEVQLDHLSPKDVAEKLDELIESLQGEPAQILSPVIFDCTRSFVRHFDALTPEHVHKFTDLLLSVFVEQTKAVEGDLEENAQHNFEQDRAALQMYTFCWHWLIEVAENRWKGDRKEEEKTAALTGKPKARTTKAKQGKGTWGWPMQKVQALNTVAKVIELDLNRIVIASSDRDTLLSMVTKSVSLLLEDPDALKDDLLKTAAAELLCLCANRFDGAVRHGLQTRIVEQYLREEHLSEFVADFMQTLVVKYEDTRLIENVLRLCTNKEFSDKEAKPAKAFSRFLVRLSEIAPKEVLKQMVHLQIHFDSESYTVRMGMMDVIGNLIHNLLAIENSETAALSLQSYYEIIQDRFRDVSSYVRVKVLQVLMRLTERREDSALTDIPIATRPALIALTAGRLHDKASNVRKNAIKLLAKFIETSPFVAIAQDEGSLSLAHFQSKQHNLEEIIKRKFPTDELPGVEETESANEDATSSAEADRMPDASPAPARPVDPPAAEGERAAGELELRHLRGLLKYYKDGIKFVKQIETVVPVMCQLLASNAKGEVIEAMNFFVTGYQFQMESATIGIRQMVHKVWDKDAGESERLSVREHLLRCYIAVYFEPAPSNREPSEIVADNLVKLTYTMTLAELTSLEQLLTLLVAKKVLEESTLQVLWSIFSSKKQAARRRRGAIIILGMIGKARKEVIAENFENLLKVGLGDSAKKDLVLARYTCVALQQLGTVKRQKGTLSAGHTRMPANHPIFTRLRDLLLDVNTSPEWFGFAEQAINAIYLLSEHPDITCGEIVKRIAARVLGLSPPPPKGDDDGDVDHLTSQLETGMRIYDGDESSIAAEAAPAASCDPLELAELCFVVGHVAIKQIVHLESIEVEWKRRKHLEEVSKTPRKRSGADEIDQVTGNAEDEFTEGIAQIRERELLYGDTLLASFGPFIAFICLHNRTFNHPVLQIMAVLALCKFMCVSADFCEAHLQLLFTILSKSDDPVIRSNTAIGLGDMTICFNSLIDQNISYLYNRLNDTDPVVKKNTLMVLTFLILNGMVKVKGQISEMAKTLEDEDRRISDLAKLFFTELSTKDNAVYNNLPDIISNLSHAETGVSEPAFRNIMKFLLEFIKKDKQTENIVDKLCMRFRNADEPRQWRDISFCLTLLSFASEKSVKKLIEHLPQYQDKLHEPVLYKNLEDILAKAKRLAKAETKSQIEDFEAKLKEHHDKCVENEQAVDNAANAKKPKHSSANRHEQEVEDAAESLSAMSLTPARKRGTAARRAADKDDERDIDDIFGTQTPAKPRRKPAAAARAAPTSDHDDDTAGSDEEEDSHGLGAVRTSARTSDAEEEDGDEEEERDARPPPRRGAKPVPQWKAALQKLGRPIHDEEDEQSDDDQASDDTLAEDSDASDEGQDEEEDEEDNEDEEEEERFETVAPKSRGRVPPSVKAAAPSARRGRMTRHAG
ncbi:non-SMC mitotic condensation complex subunit 1-domain-containing protein [Geranomyces variabilis]|nr:non-SMC mitotic condensation complex subunit 1-domain-containing protein [Geranomyces variabilis]KAJ3137681.1 Condensin complex subunit [Geranomyces variabilis]